MTEALLKGLTLGLLLSISVGPVLFSVIKQSLNNGHRGGIAFAAGVSASDIFLVLVSNVFTELFRTLKEHQREIGIAGSVFLIGAGIYFLFFKKLKITVDGQTVAVHRKRDLAKISLTGFLMNLLNPAVIIFWLTISTTLVMHTLSHRIITYTVCLAFVLAADIAKVFMAGRIRKRLTPHNIHNISRLNGLILVGFGIVLLWGLIFFADKLK
jgi:threonine/homoserine/homoserine lactone efflux protein